MSRPPACCARAWWWPKPTATRTSTATPSGSTRLMWRWKKTSKGKIIGARLASDGRAVTVGAIEKMSKSRNNGVDPQGLVDRYGADTVRLFSMFAAPPDQSLEWSESGVEGSFRFLKRLWGLVDAHLACKAPTRRAGADQLNDEQREIRRLVHETIAKVDDDIGRRLYLQHRHRRHHGADQPPEPLRRLQRAGAGGARRRLAAIVRLLNPVTPHICQALWERFGHRRLPMPRPGRWPTMRRGSGLPWSWWCRSMASCARACSCPPAVNSEAALDAAMARPECATAYRGQDHTQGHPPA